MSAALPEMDKQMVSYFLRNPKPLKRWENMCTMGHTELQEH